MFENWVDTLLAGRFETSLPTLCVSSGQIEELKGNGRLSWTPDEGIRLNGLTDGAEQLRSRLFNFGVSGQLIPISDFLLFSGISQNRWEVTADLTTENGYHINSDLQDVVWDLKLPAVSLSQEKDSCKGHELRILMGPSPNCWTRSTSTVVKNDVFDTEFDLLDWVSTSSKFGKVATRQRSEEWMEVKVLFDDDQPRDPFVIVGAIARAFGFLLGRRCCIRGYEYFEPGKITRRIDTRYPNPTKNSLHAPLGWQRTYLGYVETLLGPAIDFFLTELGERVASYLFLCWDTADNAVETIMTISCICLEGLLRVAAELLGLNKPKNIDADMKLFQKYLKQKDNQLSDEFRNRLSGITGLFNQIGPKDILRDWINRGVLRVTNEDHDAWNKTRHPLAHGHLPSRDEDQSELQERLTQYAKVQNLINKIVLQLIGYEGEYIDYSQTGFPPSQFPKFVMQSNVG